jgi:hypothetical protein
LPIIGKLLGRTQSTTTQRYAHLDNDPLKKASEHIGSRFGGGNGRSEDPACERHQLFEGETIKEPAG